MNTHQKARDMLSRLVGHEVPAGIEAYWKTFRDIQSSPPTGHRPQLHIRGNDRDQATCSCGWEGPHQPGIELAADNWLLHLDEHVEHV